MRTGLLWAGAAVLALAGALPAVAGGRGAADICTGAGYRSGTVAFDMCLSRVGTDDPLAVLEDSDDISRVPIDGRKAEEDDPLAAIEHGKGVSVQIVRVPTRNGDLQSFGNNTSFGGGNGPVPGNPGGGGPSPPPPSGGGFPGMTPPTPPTAPTAPQLPFAGGFTPFGFGD